MKHFIVVVMLLCLAPAVRAEESNGLRLTAQKTVLDRDKDREAFYQWDQVDKALGLKIATKNISFKEMAAGTIDYAVVVRRWGHTPVLYHKYTGSETFPALKPSAEATLTVAKVKMGGYEIGGNRKQYQDTIEGWQIIVKHGATETLKLTSTSDFDKLLARAKAGPTK